MTNLAIPAAGRNSPCPCGSGKRYKECHGAIGAAGGGTQILISASPPICRSRYRAPGPEWSHLSPEQQDEMGAAMESALAHQTAGRADEAAKLYKQTLELAPNTHDALHMLGVIELGFGNLELAEQLILDALKLRPPYEAIESNIRLLQESQIDKARATEDQLCERALPIFNDLILGHAVSPHARSSVATSHELHLIGRIHGEDEDDVWMLDRLHEVLWPLSPTVWAADSAAPVPRRLGTSSVIDARSGQYPRGGTHVFVGVDYELEAWIAHSRADRVIVVCGRGRPSRYLAQLRTLAMNGARRIELAFVSRARAERFGPRYTLIPLPLEPVNAPMAVASQPRETGVWSIAEPRPWSIGMVGQGSGSVVEPTDAKLIAEIATHANAMAIYDPGRYRFLLGATPSIRFVSRSNGGLTAFAASVDCFYCRPQQWWDEGAGREVLTAMALGKPVICPRDSMHASLIADRVDGLLYETHAESLELLHDLHRAPLWAAKLGEAARSKARDLIAASMLEESYRSITPATRTPKARNAVTIDTARDAAATQSEPLVRCIAFHLPQFHPIPENDQWWGNGFTEWINVTSATPNFLGHYQPQLPADSGFYDLRMPEVRAQQAALARDYGLHGFCYYYYWFAGKRLLERPVEDMLASGQPDFPYCLCWANENWTRRWDGADNEVLIAQNPHRTDDVLFIHDLLPHFRDPRYIRVFGRPLLIVYRIGLLPNPRESARVWRDIALREGIGDLYLCAAKTYDTADPARYGFDAIVEFPPHGVTIAPNKQPYDIINPDFAGTIYDYRQLVNARLLRPQPDYVVHPTVMPGWDNTARRRDLASIFVHSTPEFYEIWLREIVARVVEQRVEQERLVFVNAWNEWAEGAHLEPDLRYGHQFLHATRRAVLAEAVGGKPFVRFSGRKPELERDPTG